MYEPRFFYWDAVVTLRRVFIAASLSLLDPGGIGLPLCIFSILMMATFLQRFVLPFRGKLENRVELGALLLLLFNFYCVAVFWAPQVSPTQASTLGLALLLLNTGTAIAFAGLLVAQHSARFVSWLNRKKLRYRDWRATRRRALKSYASDDEGDGGDSDSDGNASGERTSRRAHGKPEREQLLLGVDDEERGTRDDDADLHRRNQRLFNYADSSVEAGGSINAGSFARIKRVLERARGDSNPESLIASRDDEATGHQCDDDDGQYQ